MPYEVTTKNAGCKCIWHWMAGSGRKGRYPRFQHFIPSPNHRLVPTAALGKMSGISMAGKSKLKCHTLPCEACHNILLAMYVHKEQSTTALLHAMWPRVSGSVCLCVCVWVGLGVCQQMYLVVDFSGSFSCSRCCCLCPLNIRSTLHNIPHNAAFFAGVFLAQVDNNHGRQRLFNRGSG